MQKVLVIRKNGIMNRKHKKGNYFEYPKLEINGVNYTGLCFSTLRRLPNSIKQTLIESGIWEDILSNCYLYASECMIQCMSARDTYNYAQRELYKYMVSIGWRKVQNDGKTKWIFTEKSLNRIVF